jgi:MYXO-CTERM domain-containing protein
MGGCAQTDQGCVVDCYFTGTTAGQQQFDDMSICMAEQCDGLQGDAFNECAADNCGPEIDACFPPLGTGNDSCEEVYTCLGDCAQGDNDCTLACFEEGSATAQDQINAMLTCFEEECGTLTGDAFSECAFEECAEPVQACFPAANCDLTGGDCPAGQACYPVQGGETDCFETEGGKAGASCNPNVNSVGLTCGDGLFCYPSGTSTGKCESFCFTDADCAADNTSCVAPLFTDGDVGYCAPCTDADKDGYCQGDDCNDGQAATNPGADEKCGDNVDNDCDGQKDEGCAAEDEGGESSDEGAESSDEGAESSDEGAESSDEGAESSDEGAESSDEGGDSSDEGAESSDEGGESSDEGAESADEGGGTCVDSDNDGVCAKADCDDTNPNAAPGQTELCGDNADNDCDGEVDNGCGSGSGREASGDGGAGGDGGGGASDGGAGGGGGGCSATGGSTGAPLWALGALALVFARRRRSSHR